MKRLTCSLGILLLLIAPFIGAEVVSKADTGFNLKMTAEVPVSPSVAYQQFLNVDQWWVANHTWHGSAENLSIEPKAGGCFCEISGDNEVLHMLVTFVKPNAEIKMVGGLGPLQMMGIHGGMSWRFEALDNGHTRIIQTYNVTGYAPGGLSDIADIVDAVQTGQLNALAARLVAEN